MWMGNSAGEKQELSLVDKIKGGTTLETWLTSEPLTGISESNQFLPQ